MREITGDLFEPMKPFCPASSAICVTTNGYVTDRARAVMGRGCAGQAKDRWPGLDQLLGCLLMEVGEDHVRVLTEENPVLFNDIVSPNGPDPTLMTGPWVGQNHILPYHLVSFPTKPTICGEEDVLPRYSGRRLPATHWQLVPEQTYPEHIKNPPMYAGWMARSSLDLIFKSARELDRIATDRKWEAVVLPRPGCGAGELNWAKVGPILSAILDDRFHAITFK